MKLTQKEIDNFKEWVYKTHSITKDWKPDMTSIEMWREYKSKRRVK